MYLPQEAHKSFTVPFTVIGGVVSRPAADAVENGSQITGRPSIICFWRKIKKDSIPAFSHFVKTTKTESETLYTILGQQNRDLPVFRPLEGTEFALLRVQILT